MNPVRLQCSVSVTIFSCSSSAPKSPLPWKDGNNGLSQFTWCKTCSAVQQVAKLIIIIAWAFAWKENHAQACLDLNLKRSCLAPVGSYPSNINELTWAALLCRACIPDAKTAECLHPWAPSSMFQWILVNLRGACCQHPSSLLDLNFGWRLFARWLTQSLRNRGVPASLREARCWPSGL